MPKRRTLLWCFAGFWLLTLLLYRHGYGSQFTDDYIAGIVRFMDEGWAGFADSFDFTSLYYGHNIVFYGFYSLFGSSALAWFLLFTGLHALNAALAFGFLKRLFANQQFPAASSGAMLISLLFLVSPYQTENVIWGATLHYAVSLLCFWGIAWLYASYLGNGHLWKLGLCYGIFLFSLLTLEISLVFPGILAVLFGILWKPSITLSNLLRQTKLLVLPMAAIIALYLGATYALKGHFIGHYGSANHMHFQPGQLIGGLWQYLAKLLAFVHHYPNEQRYWVYGKLALPAMAFSLLAIGMLLLILLWRYRRTWATFALGWLALVFMALLPVLNMYFNYLHAGENDRLSYVASIFIFGLPVLFCMWFAKRLVWVYGLVALVASVWLLQPQTLKWKHAAAIQNQAVDSPLFYTDGDLYLLNLPCYFNGAYIYRSLERLHWARRYYRLPDIKPRTHYVLSYNLLSPADSVTVEGPLAPNTYKVELSTWGIWFWYNYLGAQNRTDENMAITLDEWNHSYTVHFARLKPNDRLLYYTPSGWRLFPQPPK